MKNKCSGCGVFSGSGYVTNGVFTCTACEHRKPWYWKCITQPRPRRSDAKLDYIRNLEDDLKRGLI